MQTEEVQHQDELPVSHIKVLSRSAMAFTLACPTRYYLDVEVEVQHLFVVESRRVDVQEPRLG